jgi:hypothetical protein
MLAPAWYLRKHLGSAACRDIPPRPKAHGFQVRRLNSDDTVISVSGAAASGVLEHNGLQRGDRQHLGVESSQGESAKKLQRGGSRRGRSSRGADSRSAIVWLNN